MTDSHLLERGARYLTREGRGTKIKEYLGGGTDGEVWKTTDNTAIKVLKQERGYFNERDSYLRLAEWGINEQINGFWIPAMYGFDDRLMVVEMGLMLNPPYIIDFAKVMIDRPPDFSEETMREYEARGRERFEHNWRTVKSLIAALESFQIYYLDPQRGNIAFPDMP